MKKLLCAGLLLVIFLGEVIGQECVIKNSKALDLYPVNYHVSPVWINQSNSNTVTIGANYEDARNYDHSYLAKYNLEGDQLWKYEEVDNSHRLVTAIEINQYLYAIYQSTVYEADNPFVLKKISDNGALVDSMVISVALNPKRIQLFQTQGGFVLKGNQTENANSLHLIKISENLSKSWHLKYPGLSGSQVLIKRGNYLGIIRDKDQSKVQFTRIDLKSGSIVDSFRVNIGYYQIYDGNYMTDSSVVVLSRDISRDSLFLQEYYFNSQPIKQSKIPFNYNNTAFRIGKQKQGLTILAVDYEGDSTSLIRYGINEQFNLVDSAVIYSDSVRFDIETIYLDTNGNFYSSFEYHASVKLRNQKYLLLGYNYKNDRLFRKVTTTLNTSLANNLLTGGLNFKVFGFYFKDDHSLKGFIYDELKDNIDSIELQPIQANICYYYKFSNDANNSVVVARCYKSNTYDSKFLVGYYDPAGELLWKQGLDTSVFPKALNVSSTSVLVTGILKDGGLREEVWLYHYDKAGNLVNKSKLLTDTITGSYTVRIDETIVYKNGLLLTINIDKVNWIYYVSNDGTINWKRNNSDFLTQKAIVQNGELYVVGKVEINSGPGFDMDIRLMKITEQGNVDWSRDFFNSESLLGTRFEYKSISLNPNRQRFFFFQKRDNQLYPFRGVFMFDIGAGGSLLNNSKSPIEFDYQCTSTDNKAYYYGFSDEKDSLSVYLSDINGGFKPVYQGRMDSTMSLENPLLYQDRLFMEEYDTLPPEFRSVKIAVLNFKSAELCKTGNVQPLGIKNAVTVKFRPALNQVLFCGLGNFYSFRTNSFLGSLSFNSLGIVEPNLPGELTVYPNPTNGVVRINRENFTERAYSLTIMNTVGKVVGRLDLSNYQIKSIDLSDFNLPQGMYTFTIRSNNNVYTSKVLYLPK